MRIFQRMGNALSRFMYGRNGGDQLGMAIIWLAILLDLINMFLKEHQAAHTAVSAIATALFVLEIFRLLSRNLQKRRAENLRFLQKVWWPLCGKTKGLKDHDHKYFACPSCGTLCRVPKGKGTILITCPRCRLEIKKRT